MGPLLRRGKQALEPGAERWSTLYQKGMRVLVEGRTARDEWADSEEHFRVTFKIEARRIGILPYRIENVTMTTKVSEPDSPQSE